MRRMAARDQGLGPVGGRRLGIRRRVIGRLFMRGADGFAPGIGVVGVDVFVLGEGQGLDQGFGRDTTAKSRSLAALGMTRGLAAIALAGLKTRHYNLRAWKAQR